MTRRAIRGGRIVSPAADATKIHEPFPWYAHVIAPASANKVAIAARVWLAGRSQKDTTTMYVTQKAAMSVMPLAAYAQLWCLSNSAEAGWMRYSSQMPEKKPLQIRARQDWEPGTPSQPPLRQATRRPARRTRAGQVPVRLGRAA